MDTINYRILHHAIDEHNLREFYRIEDEDFISLREEFFDGNDLEEINDEMSLIQFFYPEVDIKDVILFWLSLLTEEERDNLSDSNLEIAETLLQKKLDRTYLDQLVKSFRIEVEKSVASYTQNIMEFDELFGEITENSDKSVRKVKKMPEYEIIGSQYGICLKVGNINLLDFFDQLTVSEYVPFIHAHVNSLGSSGEFVPTDYFKVFNRYTPLEDWADESDRTIRKYLQEEYITIRVLRYPLSKLYSKKMTKAKKFDKITIYPRGIIVFDIDTSGGITLERFQKIFFNHNTLYTKNDVIGQREISSKISFKINFLPKSTSDKNQFFTFDKTVFFDAIVNDKFNILPKFLFVNENNKSAMAKRSNTIFFDLLGRSEKFNSVKMLIKREEKHVTISVKDITDKRDVSEILDLFSYLINIYTVQIKEIRTAYESVGVPIDIKEVAKSSKRKSKKTGQRIDLIKWWLGPENSTDPKVSTRCQKKKQPYIIKGEDKKEAILDDPNSGASESNFLLTDERLWQALYNEPLPDRFKDEDVYIYCDPKNPHFDAPNPTFAEPRTRTEKIPCCGKRPSKYGKGKKSVVKPKRKEKQDYIQEVHKLGNEEGRNGYISQSIILNKMATLAGIPSYASAKNKKDAPIIAQSFSESPDNLLRAILYSQSSDFRRKYPQRNSMVRSLRKNLSDLVRDDDGVWGKCQQSLFGLSRDSVAANLRNSEVFLPIELYGILLSLYFNTNIFTFNYNVTEEGELENEITNIVLPRYHAFYFVDFKFENNIFLLKTGNVSQDIPHKYFLLMMGEKVFNVTQESDEPYLYFTEIARELVNNSLTFIEMSS